MDLNVHRAILFLSLSRAAKRISGRNLMDTFHPLWLGNWLTDMNQASAFFNILDDDRDPYNVWDDGIYKFPKTIEDNKDEWTRLHQELWRHEWDTLLKLKEFRNLSPSAAMPKNIDYIGGYYPYDHFDVVDRKDLIGSLLDAYEFHDPQNTGMTWTAYQGIFVECKYRQLHVIFSQPLEKRKDIENLRILGYAIHTLQDFFAHSNFVEVLLRLFANAKKLPNDFTSVLDIEQKGAFSAYATNTNPAQTMVMTGRFDRVDTIASILKIYRNSLVPRWNDLDAGGYHAKNGKTRDLFLEVLFGTYSDLPFSSEILKNIKTIFEIKDFLDTIGKSIENAIIKTFAWVGELFTDPNGDRQIEEFSDLMLAVNSEEAKDYGKAGRILYLEHLIEQKLRNDLANAKKPILPHHTLLAKDHDVGHPEIRLAYKLACCIATDVTTDILESYFKGERLGSVDAILKRYYRHPRELLYNNAFAKSLNDALAQMYGVRWWLWADDDGNRFQV